MIATPGAILTLGLGGSPSLMVTLGYGLGAPVPPVADDTHDGFWHREWLKRHKKKQPTIAEIVEAVQEHPAEAVAQAKAIPEVVAKYPEVSIEAVRQNLALQRFLARQILEIMQEEDDVEALLLL